MTDTQYFFPHRDTLEHEPGPVSQACRHAPTAVDILESILEGAHARLRSPLWAEHRLEVLDRQIAELVRERDAVARCVR